MASSKSPRLAWAFPMPEWMRESSESSFSAAPQDSSASSYRPSRYWRLPSSYWAPASAGFARIRPLSQWRRLSVGKGQQHHPAAGFHLVVDAIQVPWVPSRDITFEGAHTDRSVSKISVCIGALPGSRCCGPCYVDGDRSQAVDDPAGFPIPRPVVSSKGNPAIRTPFGQM